MFKNEENSAQENESSVNTETILRDLAVDYMHDKKVKRRWKIALFILFGLYLISIAGIAMRGSGGNSFTEEHTAVVNLDGVIGSENGVLSYRINKGLRNAFEAKSSKGVILLINSPGGSPVQSDNINKEMLRLRDEFPEKPLYVVMSDLAASGGYFVAVAAEKIFANPATIVGSIGVRMDSFGFVDAINKLGVERRSITAGANKSILDPFLPMVPQQKQHAEKMLDQVHKQFIEVVKQGRGDKLTDDPDIFSGLFWSGEESLRLGLIDGFGNLTTVARDEIGAEDLVDYSIHPDIFEQFSKQLGVSIGAGLATAFGNGFSLQ